MHVCAQSALRTERYILRIIRNMIVSDPLYHHPPMDRRKRSKIFAPFEALEGYSESIDGVNADYMEHIELCETNKSEPGRRLTILSSPASNEKPALHNHVEESFDFDFQDIEWCEEDR